MRRIKNLLRGLVAGSLIFSISPVELYAGSASTSLSVSATVASSCTISTAAIDFGSYDPVVTHAAANLDGTGTVTITCTKGTVTTVGLDLGANAVLTTRRMAAGTERLTYELYKDSGRTSVWGSSGGNLLDTGVAPSKAARPFTVYGRVPSGQDISAGSYSDTVTATVNF